MGASLRGDVVFAWNEVMLQFSAAAREPLAPHLEARAFAMAHLAIADAISSVSSQKDSGADVAAQRAAAVCAAHDVLVNLLPAGVRTFDALWDRHLGGMAEGTEKKRGMSAGHAAAARVLLQRANDGWAELALSLAGSEPMPDTSEGAASALARGQRVPPSPWLKLAPFALRSPQQFTVVEVQTLQHDGSTVVESALKFSKLFDGVDRAAAVDSAEQCWSQRSLITWNRIARQLSVGRITDLSGQAGLLATLNVALAEATLSTMHWRHVVGSWRATTTDMWEPLRGSPARPTDVLARIDGIENDLVRRETRRVLIPPMPNYPSLAATIAGAAQASLVSYFKTDQIDFILPAIPRAPGLDNSELHGPRTFTRISSAAREYAFLSSLDGRHCREACISGYSLGSSIGSYVGKRAAVARR